jgi:hypothetical protein
LRTSHDLCSAASVSPSVECARGLRSHGSNGWKNQCRQTRSRPARARSHGLAGPARRPNRPPPFYKDRPATLAAAKGRPVTACQGLLAGVGAVAPTGVHAAHLASHQGRLHRGVDTQGLQEREISIPMRSWLNEPVVAVYQSLPTPRGNLWATTMMTGPPVDPDRRCTATRTSQNKVREDGHRSSCRLCPPYSGPVPQRHPERPIKG